MICHHYKCLFVHIPKTGGQSVEQVFLDKLGLSWETRAPLLLRHNPEPQLGPPRLAHLKIHEYLKYKYVSPAMFDEYFKFSVIRNPWARAVSMYKYYDCRVSFKKFLFSVLHKNQWDKRFWFVGPQHQFICDEDDKICVDYVCRLESLEQDFKQVSKAMGLQIMNLPHKNKSSHAQGRLFSGIRDAILNGGIRDLLEWRGQKEAFPRYVDYYDNESKDLVAELYKKDVELFGYQFGEALEEKIIA